MRIIVCLLLAIAGGFGAYVFGAVLWSLCDPTGAGAALLFTIPVAIVGMAVPALLALLMLIHTGGLHARKPVATSRPLAATAGKRQPRKPVPFRPVKGRGQPQPQVQLAAA